MSAVSYLRAREGKEAEIEEQRARVLRYARSANLQIEDEYIEAATAGQEEIDSRPEGQRLSREIAHHHYSALVVDCLDCLSANSEEIDRFYRYLQENGVTLHAADIGEVQPADIEQLG